MDDGAVIPIGGGASLVVTTDSHVIQPIFFPGDFGQNGGAAETRLIVQQVRQFTQPVIAVSGNHDSALLMRRLAGPARILGRDHHSIGLCRARERLRLHEIGRGEPSVRPEVEVGEANR